MITLKADNRQLTKNAKFSYLSTNYAAGVTSLVLVSGTGFAQNDYVLLGEFGNEETEIVQVSNVSTNTLTVGATLYPHAQDTRVTILKYNQIKFYQTAAATFDSNENALGTENIQADSYYTYYYDTTNTSGYGWFAFYNSTTAKITTNSNAIPYAGFETYSVKEIIDGFLSLLNNKEMKLVNHDDLFRWLNEAYAIATNELNLVNPDYNIPAEWSFTVTSSTTTSSLPSDFGELISITDSDGDEVGHIDISEKREWDDEASVTDVRYYIRGTTIGITPTPTDSTTYYVYYKSKSTRLTSYYDNIDLPENNFYFLIDGMRIRASQKLPRLSGKTVREDFQQGIERMKVTAHKQNENLDSFEVADTANV